MTGEITTEVSKLTGNDTVIGRGRLTGVYIHDLDVTELYRRHGLGSEIVRELIGLGGRRLWCAVDNLPALAMYEKLGFKQIREDGGYYEMELVT